MLMAAMNSDVNGNQAAVLPRAPNFDALLPPTRAIITIDISASPLAVDVMERLIAPMEAMSEIVQLIVTTAQHPVIGTLVRGDVMEKRSAPMEAMNKTAKLIVTIAEGTALATLLLVRRDAMESLSAMMEAMKKTVLQVMIQSYCILKACMVACFTHFQRNAVHYMHA